MLKGVCMHDDMCIRERAERERNQLPIGLAYHHPLSSTSPSSQDPRGMIALSMKPMGPGHKPQEVTWDPAFSAHCLPTVLWGWPPSFLYITFKVMKHTTLK